MKALQINFAPKRAIPVWFWLALIAVGFTVTVDQGWRARRVQQALQGAKAQIAAAEEQAAKQQELDLQVQRAAQIPPPYAQDAAQTAHMASLPLDQILNAVERTKVQGIQISSIDVSATDGSVRVEIYFQDHAVLLKYLKELNLGEEPTRWVLSEAKQGSNRGLTQNTAILLSTWNETN